MGMKAYHVLPYQFLELEHNPGARGESCIPPLWKGVFGGLYSCIEFPLYCLWQARDHLLGSLHKASG
jgi:hypothetical protein